MIAIRFRLQHHRWGRYNISFIHFAAILNYIAPHRSKPQCILNFLLMKCECILNQSIYSINLLKFMTKCPVLKAIRDSIFLWLCIFLSSCIFKWVINVVCIVSVVWVTFKTFFLTAKSSKLTLCRVSLNENWTCIVEESGLTWLLHMYVSNY